MPVSQTPCQVAFRIRKWAALPLHRLRLRKELSFQREPLVPEWACFMQKPIASGFWKDVFLFALCIFGSAGSVSAVTLAEAVDATNLVWTTGGDAAWFAQTTNTHDGVDAVQSGPIGTNEVSWIETTVEGPATVSYWMLSGIGYMSAFTINGVAPGISYLCMSGSWCARTNDLGSGPNVLRWAVHRDPRWPSTSAPFVFLDEFTVAAPRPLQITSQSADQTVFSGEWVLFSVDAIGTPPIHYQWLKDGTNIANATNFWFSIQAATTNDAGAYSVVLSNSQGTVAGSNATLTVLPPAAPFFTYEPQDRVLYTGESLYLMAIVSGSPPFHYQWRKDGTNLPNADWSALMLPNISHDAAGSYSVVVTNEWGSIESSNAVLTVLPSVAPVLTKHPRSLEVAAGVNTWLSANATGVPEPRYDWTKVGAPSSPGSDKKWLDNVTSDDAGIYFARAANVAGQAVSREALVTVLPPVSVTGSWWYGAEDIWVTNGLAFLAQGSAGLSIISVSNPASAVMLGGYNTPGTALSVHVSGDLAFVADGSAGLQIVDVGNPHSPVLAGAFNTPGYARQVAVRGNLAFVADGSAGLLILDVGDPTAPSMVSGYKTDFNADCLTVAGDFVFVSSPYLQIGGANVRGFFVIDVSNPAEPVEVGRLTVGFSKLVCRGPYVFGIDSYRSMSVVSVADPAQPTVIGSFSYYNGTNRPPWFISAYDIRVANYRVYLAGYSDEQLHLYILDVRDPTEPIPVGYFSAPGRARTLAVDGPCVYLADWDSPVLILETPFENDPEIPPRLSIFRADELQLRLHGKPGRHYSIEHAGGLSGFPWHPLGDVFLTNSTTLLPVPVDEPMRFFRFREMD
jgi:hypothetical protein